MKISETMKASRDIRSLGKAAFFLVSLATIGWLVKETGLASLLTTSWIDQEVKGQGIAGEALFVLIGTAFTAIGLPRQIVSFMGGYAFGVLNGVALALLATILGCVLAFYYARVMGQKVILKRAPRRIQKIDTFLSRSPFAMTLVIRLLPIGSNFLTCLAAGVSSIGAFSFIVGSALGYIPQTLIFALVGSGASVSSEIQFLTSALLFLISGGVGLMLYRRYGREVSVTDQDDDQTETGATAK
ncbi:MAG: VTT domain-containing protein [Alphaproteobacteria bacterium]|nr:VTT domain-containing protein [Alphaproteobacteria bacterium]MBT7746612.1 VTT domain-containing protein [Alphaproteobacteria bacterium]